MKSQHLVLTSLALCLPVLIAACGAKDTPQPAQQESPAPPEKLIASANPKPGEVPLPPMEDLYQQWFDEATKVGGDPDTQKLTVLAGLVGQYPEGYPLFFDLIEKADTDPRLKVMATISMVTYVFPKDTARLVQMTEAGNDSTTRACAAQLLSSIPQPAPEANTRLKELMDDPTLQVKVAAVLALATHGNGEAAARLLPLWKEEGLTPAQRSNILYALPDAGAMAYRDIYLDAVQMRDLTPQLRISLIEQLSELSGDAGVRDALEKMGQEEPDEDVKLMAQGAAAAMRNAPLAPSETPAKKNSVQLQF